MSVVLGVEFLQNLLQKLLHLGLGASPGAGRGRAGQIPVLHLDKPNITLPNARHCSYTRHHLLRQHCCSNTGRSFVAATPGAFAAAPRAHMQLHQGCTLAATPGCRIVVATWGGLLLQGAHTQLHQGCTRSYIRDAHLLLHEGHTLAATQGDAHMQPNEWEHACSYTKGCTYSKNRGSTIATTPGMHTCSNTTEHPCSNFRDDHCGDALLR